MDLVGRWYCFRTLYWLAYIALNNTMDQLLTPERAFETISVMESSIELYTLGITVGIIIIILGVIYKIIQLKE